MSQGHLHGFIADAFARIEAGVYATEGTPRLASNGSFVKAIRRDEPTVVAEVKPRSPSEGRILTGDVEDLVRAYVEGGAAAISCLADADHFDGSPQLVRMAVETSGLPVLWKDFVVEPAQVAAAAHHGASAVLLIERCFADVQEREDLVQIAHEAGLEVLLEVHGETDWSRAQESAADCFGVNARDLDTLAVDAEGARRLVATIAAAGRPVLALSGVRSRHDREAAEGAGADGVLVGSMLVKHPLPRLALRALRRPLAKVCGVTGPAALQTALVAGADIVGFVVGSPDSPRNLRPMDAQRLAGAARAAGLATALVTRHPDTYEVREWCRLVRPDIVQLHGQEVDDEWIHSLTSIPTQVVHAVAADPKPDPAKTETGMGIVIDTPRSDGSTGGAGETHDWTASAALVDVDPGRFSLIAGGLHEGNAAHAVAASGAWGADASSGLESSPGTKDANAVAAYVAAVHGGIR